MAVFGMVMTFRLQCRGCMVELVQCQREKANLQPQLDGAKARAHQARQDNQYLTKLLYSVMVQSAPPKQRLEETLVLLRR